MPTTIPDEAYDGAQTGEAAFQEALRAADAFGLPMETCYDCGGHGHHARRDYTWTSQMRDEDPEGFEAYMAGADDVTCTTCHGHRVVPQGYKQGERAHPKVRGLVLPNGDIVQRPRADY